LGGRRQSSCRLKQRETWSRCSDHRLLIWEYWGRCSHQTHSRRCWSRH
jgi:hypothetical protein